jgi:hypothetical protein
MNRGRANIRWGHSSEVQGVADFKYEERKFDE